MTGASLKKAGPGKAAKPSSIINRSKQTRSAKDLQAQAITYAYLMEDTYADWELELNLPEKALMDFDADFPGTDDDYYDFSELGTDSPLLDADAATHHSNASEKNPFEAEAGALFDDPFADIIIDEFGQIQIPKEELLLQCYIRLSNEKNDGSAYSVKLQQRLNIVSQLRRLAEEVLLRQKKHIFGNETDFSKATLAPMTQIEVMKHLDIPDKTIMTRLVNCYIKTPRWGVIHLSEFFQGTALAWDQIISRIRDYISKEDPAMPYSNEMLWRQVSDLHPKALADNRMFRNKLREAGIPPRKARMDIFSAIKKWSLTIIPDKEPHPIQHHEIGLIREKLSSEYKIFLTSQTRQCLESQFAPFIEKYIIQCLRKLNIPAAM